MLTFSLNNKHLALNTDTSVRITWRNPACNFENIPGDVGLGIDIPVNDVNRSIFGAPERFEKHIENATRRFPDFEIRFGGYLLIAGTYIITDANQESYIGWLRSYVGDIGEAHRERKITDTPSFNEEIVFENKGNYDPEIDEYGCPEIYNPEFFAEKGEKVIVNRLRQNPNFGKHVWKSVIGFIPWYGIDNDEYISYELETEDLTEAFLKSAGWMVNKTVGGQVLTEESMSFTKPEMVVKNLKVTAVSPMLFLNHVLRTLLRDLRVNIRENFLEEDDDLKRLLIYNNFDITKIDYLSGEVSYILVKKWDSLDNTAIVEFVPDIRSIGYLAEKVRRVVNTFLYKDLLPQISFKDFVMNTQNMLNVFLHFLPGRKLVDVIDRESIFTEPAISLEDYLTGFWTMGEKKQSTLKFSFEHDSNDMFIARRWVDITDFRADEKDAVDTWDDLLNIANPDTGEIRFVREANAYAQYKLWLNEWDDEETGEHRQEKYVGWQTLTIGFQNAFFNYGMEEEEEIRAGFSTLDGETAAARQKGNIRSELFAFESFSPRMLFYLGNNKAAFQTDNISLDWEQEETGLLATRWQNWARFWATRQPVESDADLPLNMLDYVIRNIYRKFRAREGEFIIEEMETEFRLNRIGATKIRGHKIGYTGRTLTLKDWIKLDDPIWFDYKIDFDRFNNIIQIP